MGTLDLGLVTRAPPVVDAEQRRALIALWQAPIAPPPPRELAAHKFVSGFDVEVLPYDRARVQQGFQVPSDILLPWGQAELLCPQVWWISLQIPFSLRTFYLLHVLFSMELHEALLGKPTATKPLDAQWWYCRACAQPLPAIWSVTNHCRSEHHYQKRMSHGTTL